MIEIVPIEFDEFLDDTQLADIKAHWDEAERHRKHPRLAMESEKLAQQHDKRIQEIIDLAQRTL